MMYKIPMPTKANGVKLYTLPNQQIGVEYQKGVPEVGRLAFDSVHGASRTLSIRRPEIDRIIADAVRKVAAQDDAMPKAGKPPIGNSKMQATPIQYDDEASEVISNLMSYLEDKLTPEQLEGVISILSSGDAPDNDAGERQTQAADRRRAARLGADQARRRPMSQRDEAEFMAMFPHVNRLV
jgi:hypothetical protein